MKKISLAVSLATLFIALTVSCGKDNPLSSGDFAEAHFSLSVEFPQTKTGVPVSNIDQGKITIYYGDANRTSFQQGRISGDSLIFNYPVLLEVGDPGRLRAIYADHRLSSQLFPGAETLTDSLYVDSVDPMTIDFAYVDDKYRITLHFKHCNALADFTIIDKNGTDLTDQIDKIFLLAFKDNGAEKIYTDVGSKVILPAGSSLKYANIYLKNGKEIKANNQTDITLERNKRYPIRITSESGAMSLSPRDGIDDWNQE